MTASWLRSWREWPARALPELGTARTAGLISGSLFVLCGLMVAAFAPLVPQGPHVHRFGVLAVGLAAALTGVVVTVLPWHRWRRDSSLWLIPLAFAFVSLHNTLTGANGFRYDVLYFVVYVWIGVMHRAGVSLASTPVMVASYLAPALWLHDLSTLAPTLAYTLPVCLLIGESVAIVGARARRSEAVVRANEQRLHALVFNASDVVVVLDADAIIRWESPSISAVLGYQEGERVGTVSFGYVRSEHLPEFEQSLCGLLDQPGDSRVLEVQLRHKNGSWRWCELRIRNLLDDPAVGGFVVNLVDVTERHTAESVRRQLAAIVECSADAIIGQSLDGTILSWNSAAERMYQFAAEHAVGRNIALIVPADLRGELAAALLQLRAGRPVTIETQRVRRDGEVLDVSVSMSPVRDSDGQVSSLAAIGRDISAQVRALRALADSEFSFRLLFAANPQPMWVYDAMTLKIVEVNDAAVQHYGYSREQFLGLDITMIRPPEDVGRLIESVAHDRGRLSPDAWRHLLADGRIIDVEVTSHTLEFGGRDCILVAVQDVTDRNALDAQLRHQAFHDSLTGLANRALFTDRVEHTLGRRGAEPPIVLLLDLDRFKLVNDSLGHAAGDEMLVEAGRRLQDAVRQGDTVARLGGDEFAVLLESCQVESAEQQAVRALRALDPPMLICGHQVSTSASVGIAVGVGAMSAGELLRNADVAMYRAKAAGGGRVQLFQPAMYAAAARQMELTASLRRAVDEQQFVLDYQPVVDVSDGRVAGLEALIRWQHPEHGLLSPVDFIPLAEDAGLILEIGAWVLREACRRAAEWADPDAKVNVNLSGRQLADPQIMSHVRRALAESGLAPSRLTLEITESVVMQHSHANVRRLRRLRDIGVGLAVDDFGTGYSSLAYLRAFPVHELKIDKSFVAAVPGDEEAVAVIRTILQLAASLSLDTVAEGVETAAQYDVLRALGCDRVQGYYVCRPKPWADALAVAAGPRPWHVAANVPSLT